MTDDEEALRQILANAELVIEQFKGPSDLEDFGFNEPSVEWVDGFIERQRAREGIGPEFVDRLVNILGCFLGECIIRCYGGRWARGDDGWRVEFNEENAAYPFAKVGKQFANGSEDSVYSFFTAIPIVFRFQPPPDQSMPRSLVAELLSRIRKLSGPGR